MVLKASDIGVWGLAFPKKKKKEEIERPARA